MESIDEETRAQESSRSGARPLGRTGPQRGQAASQSRKRPQRRPSQKPQESNRSAAQRAAAAPRPPQEAIEILIAAIRARFGPQAIALGNAGIRYSAPSLR